MIFDRNIEDPRLDVLLRYVTIGVYCTMRRNLWTAVGSLGIPSFRNLYHGGQVYVRIKLSEIET